MSPKALALALLLACGCEPIQSPSIPAGQPIAAKPSVYSFGEVGQSQFKIEYDRAIRLFEVKNNKTGKVYLISYHEGSVSESLVKLDEWVEPVAGEAIR